MSQYVTLEMNYSTYNNLLDWLILEASKNINSYDEMDELVHLVNFLEEEYERDCGRRNKEYHRWIEIESLFEDKYEDAKYYLNYTKVDNILKEYEEDDSLEIKISDRDKFHMICEIIDALVKEDKGDD